MANKDSSDATWRGVKKGALANAIRDRLRTLVDQLSPLAPHAEHVEIKSEIAALLEQFPEVDR